jgi:chitinase
MNLTNFSNSKSAIISFGGQANVSLAQYAYQNVQAGKTTQNQAVKDLVTKIKSVITMYPNIIGLDFDIESEAQSDGSAIYWALALKCIKKMYPKLRISYTVPVSPDGLTSDGLGIFTKYTFNQGFYPDVVNLMVMDYGVNTTDMGQAAVNAIKATYKQLLPSYQPVGPFGYANLGFTPMIGVNDTKPETTTLANMDTMCQFAQQNGVGMLAFWDAQADLPCILDDNYKAICLIPSTTYTGQPAGAYAKAFENCMPTS